MKHSLMFPALALLVALTAGTPALASPPGISISQVDGRLLPGEISTGRPITFHMNYYNTTGQNITGATNGFAIYSPDGAQWTASSGQHTGAFTPFWDYGVFVSPFSADGMGADTIGFGGLAIWGPGVPVGYDGVPFTITVGPFPDIYDGYHLCIDSAWYRPGGQWVWQLAQGSYAYPAWAGPYCYTIRVPQTQIAVSPDTLVFYDLAGAMNPPAQTLHVFDLGGGTLNYTASEGATWLNLSKTAGTTPDDILVSANGDALNPGTYFADITVLSPESFHGATAVVKLVVGSTPEGAAIVLDHVDGMNALGQIRSNVPVTFYLRAINTLARSVHGLTNGFSISSPNGAQWQSTVGDTLGSMGSGMFDGGFFINYFGADGAGADTVGFGGVVYFGAGMPSGYNEVAFSITIGPIDPAYVGRTICLDTCFYPPAGYWLWSDEFAAELAPFWSGRACFEIIPYVPSQEYDSLLFPSQTVYSGPNVQPVVVKTSEPIKGATIPIRIPAGVEVADLSTAGLVTETWNFTITDIRPDSGFAFIALANSHGDTIPTGEHTVCNILYRTTNSSCDQGFTFRWDTTLSADVSRRLTFVGMDLLPIDPAFNYLRDQVNVLPILPGDVNGDGVVAVSDLTFLIAFMFRGGPPPGAINTTDVNGDCRGPDVADLVTMIDALFQAGPPMQCGCIGAPAAKVLPSDVVLNTSFESGFTTVSIVTPIELRGVELTLSGPAAGEPVKLVGDNLDMVNGYVDGFLRVGLLDLDGGAVLPVGDHPLLRIEGEYTLKSALVADRDANLLAPGFGAFSRLPHSYELSQNYPNPFNPVTTISFALPQATEVTLEIFNVAGQKISTLVNRPMTAGTHFVEWNGTDASGHSVASGVYLYRLTAGDFSQAKKMLLLK